jgi:hypothetical protein
VTRPESHTPLLRATAAGWALRIALISTTAWALTGCGTEKVDPGQLSAGQRSTAQTALNTLHRSNIASQLVAISENAQAVPTACRVHPLSTDSDTFHVYVFWIPWLGGEDYAWLNMTIAADPSRDKFHLGLAHPVLPGGRLSQNGTGIVPWSADTTLLSLYGPAQARKSHEVLLAHAGDAFSKPGASCQVLRNGDLRLLPDRPSPARTAG